MWPVYWPLIGWEWLREQDTGLWLVECDHVIWILASHWSGIGRKLDTGLQGPRECRQTASWPSGWRRRKSSSSQNWIYLQTQRIRVWRSVLSIRPVCKSLFNRQWMVCGQWERKILRSQLSSEERTTVSKIFSRLGLWLETVGDWWLHHILETIIR